MYQRYRPCITCSYLVSKKNILFKVFGIADSNVMYYNDRVSCFFLNGFIYSKILTKIKKVFDIANKLTS